MHSASLASVVQGSSLPSNPSSNSRFLYSRDDLPGLQAKHSEDMTLQHASASPLLHSAFLGAVITATGSTRVTVHRQGPISTTTSQAISPGPGPASIQTSTTTTTTTSDFDTTTMAPTSTPSSTPTPTDLPAPSTNLPSSGIPTSYSSSGTSSATPQPSSSPSPSSSRLDFTVQNMTTCTSALISWDYNGEEAELFLSITNVDFNVDDVNALSRIKARQLPAILIDYQLADTNTSARSWTWSSVNVTQGWYEIQGRALTSQNLRNTSAPFFVSNGTDVTCLTGTSPQPSGPSSTSSLSASHSTNTASIVGGVVGAIVGLALVVFAGLYLRSRRRRKLFSGAGFGRRKWGSLKSATSSIQPERGGSASQRSSANLHTHSESTGTILHDVAGGNVSAATTPGGSDEEVTAMGEEKLFSPASSTGVSPFDVLNTPVHYDRRASLHSDQTFPAVAVEASQSRSGSLRMSTQSLGQNLEQQAQRIRNSMETSTRRLSERLSIPGVSPGLSRLPHSPTYQPQEYPLSPMTSMPVNRSVSTGAVSLTTRRPPRKPVPQYDPSLLLEDTKTDSVSTITNGAESSQSHGTGVAAGANGTLLTPPNLVHNASFGDGRPVHYLIPDMPPPQRD